MKKFTFVLLAVMFAVTASAQNKFQISINQTGYDFNDLNSIKRMADGYIMVGTTGSTSTNLNDLAVTKVDFNMNVLWSKSIGTASFDEKIDYLSKSVVFEDNGMVILANTTQAGTRDLLLTKLDYNGSVLWSKSYNAKISGTSYNDNASTICKTNTGYYLCGYTTVSSTGYGLVIKVDTSGTEQWSKYFVPQAGAGCTLWASINLSSNDLVVSGAYGSGASDTYLLKISTSGAIVWQKTFVNSNYDNIHDLAEDKNNTLLCAMMVDGYYTNARGGLLNIDLATGSLVWAKSFDLDLNNDRDGQMVGLLKNSDGSTMLAFIYTNASAGSLKHDIAIVKLDSNANLVWSKKYNTPDCDQWPKIFPNNENYLICAERANNRYASEKYYLLGLGSDGKSGCNEASLSPVVTTLTGFNWGNFATSLSPLTINTVAQTLSANSIIMEKQVACVNTGLEEFGVENNNYKVFPNPAKNEIQISSSIAIESIEIYNELGQLIIKARIQTV